MVANEPNCITLSFGNDSSALIFRISAMLRPSYALVSKTFGAPISRNAFFAPVGARRAHPAWIITLNEIANM